MSDPIFVIREPTPVLVVAAPGPQGVPGGSGGSFTHSQSPAGDPWTIPHNLGYRPSIDAYDASGNRLYWRSRADPTSNTTVLTFGTAIAGTAYLS
jgi:hypothetical protein